MKTSLALVNVSTILLGIISISLVYSKKIISERDMGKLVFANVLFRHGDRTPLNPYPNDPYKNVSFWPVGFGQLTNLGKEQEYELGQWLRRRYDALLTDMYSEDVVYVRSTDVDRTLMSAASNLAAIYPPKGSQKWNPKLNWQPIPIHTMPEHLDSVLSGKKPCPAYDRELERVLKSPEIQALNERFADVYKVLNEYTGRKATTLKDIEYVFNTLYIESLYNFTLPTWTKSVFPEPMLEASKFSFAMSTWTPKLARLKSGLLVQDMIGHLHKKSENKAKPNRNMWIYSAHDSTISSLLNTLGVFDLQIPAYASAVLMELRVDSQGNHQVTMFLRNSTIHEPYLLTLPGCTPVCPLDMFLQLCEAVVPLDWERECQASSLFDMAHALPYRDLSATALVTSSLLVLLLLLSAALYWQRSRRRIHCPRYKQLTIIPWDYNKTGSHNNPIFTLQR
uniref:acid phosphatase n=1 Tax=Cuerna arida TaxID=1464854 RepID=A0A1B6G422_9HEMI